MNRAGCARRRLARCGGLLVLALLACPAPPALATAAPAWSISAAPYPSNFETGVTGEAARGPGFLLTATNVGGAASSGSFTVRDQLPVGLSLAPGAEGETKHSLTSLTCSSGSAQSVECSSSAAIGPGDSAVVYVPVQVEASAGTLTDLASVEQGGAATTSTSTPVVISAERQSFDFIPGPSGFFGITTDEDGSAATQGASHPYEMTIGLHFPYFIAGEPLAGGGGVKNLEVSLPRGLAVNPNAVATCTEAQLEEAACPAESQVGTVLTALPITGLGTGVAGVFNMVPAPGSPGEFAFEVTAGVIVHLRGGVRSNGEYVLFATADETLAKVPVFGAEVTLWGDPSDPSHDFQRPGEAAVSRTGTAFLTLPGDCSGSPLRTDARASSWLEPAVLHQRSFESGDLAGNPVAIGGCGQIPYEPRIEARPVSESSTPIEAADSPTGLDFDLHQPQDESFGSLSTASLKDTTVTLPQGMAVDPAAADGLGACTTAEIGYEPAGGKARFSEAPASCPDAAKVGTVAVSTPLLAHELPGAVYLAKPFANPFGSLIALYLDIEDPRSGIVAKLAGRVTADPQTGQLTASFEENPELPLEDVALHLFGGSRASLQTPPLCGSYTTSSTLVPWSAPDAPAATPSDLFQIDQAAGGGGSCPRSEAQQPNAPGFSAGTTVPRAGAFSPFVLNLSRSDGSQRFGVIDTTLPPGLTGKLAGVPYCSEAQIAAAKAREAPNLGAAEQVSPSCPAASEVGVVDVGAGAGPAPLHVQGHAYLAGPYEGAPLSLVIITPAVAGPFDLGDVVVRTALFVNPETAQIHAVSDPLPSILQGIPLDLRSIALRLRRPEFTLNPTSCAPLAIDGTETSLLGGAAVLNSRFQVGGCAGLGFRPRLALRLKGGTARTKFPALTATVIATPGQANIGRAVVALPHSEFLEQGHIRTICTRVQFAAAACPPASVYGHARAFTPLLDRPLEGPVYLRSSNHNLPDLVAALKGPPSQPIEIDLDGRIDSVHGGIRNSFEAVPDAPVTKFVLSMQGGRKGLLVNSRNLCRGKASRASARFVGQNGKAEAIRPVLRDQCRRHRKTSQEGDPPPLRRVSRKCKVKPNRRGVM